jgi:hypothetical protein
MPQREKIKTELVNSSNIKALGYEPTTRVLQVDFWNGAIYQYEPITLEAFHDLKNAESIGAHFNLVIKPNPNVNFFQLQEKHAKK